MLGLSDVLFDDTRPHKGALSVQSGTECQFNPYQASPGRPLAPNSTFYSICMSSSAGPVSKPPYPTTAERNIKILDSKLVRWELNYFNITFKLQTHRIRLGLFSGTEHLSTSCNIIPMKHGHHNLVISDWN